MHKIDNVFTQEQIDVLNINIRSNPNKEIDKALGRLAIDWVGIPLGAQDILAQIASTFDKNMAGYSEALYVEYNKKYGSPNLPPHFDGDGTDLIINYQLESNTRWDVGVGLKTYQLEDNSAICFNPNENIHWRPHKEFEKGEYVKMMFFRFYNSVNPSDYSHLRLSQRDPVFDKTRALRDST